MYKLSINLLLIFLLPIMILGFISCSEQQDIDELAQHKIIFEGKELDFGDQILYLIIVLEFYRSHVGSYPPDDIGLDALLTKPDKPEISEKWNGPYATDELFIDPWNRPLYYAVEDGVINLRSLGEDGIISSDDMIASEMYPDVFREMKKLSEAGMNQMGNVESPPPQDEN